MIIGLLYSLLHLFVGILAAVLVVRRVEAGGLDDGCFVFLIGFIAFVFWPLAFLWLAIDWAVNSLSGGD